MTHKNITNMGEAMLVAMGGETRRRLSLFAGPAVLAMGILGGAALAPGAALAQTVTCVAVPTSGDGTAAAVYAAGTYNPGITCTYTGSGGSVLTSGAVTVSSTAGGDGVNLAGTGANSVTWNSSAGALTAGALTNGPVIDASTASGAINITTAAITGTQTSVTHGVNAVSTGGGAIAITNAAGNVNINSSAAGAQQQSAIRAVTTGGNGAVNITTNGTVTGRVRGIEARSSGTGALNITANGAVGVNSGAGVGVAAIEARTGTGALSVNIATGAGTVSGGTGAAILTNAGGNQTIAVASGRTVTSTGTSPATLDLTSVGSTTVSNAGSISAPNSGSVAILASAGSLSLTNSGTLSGRLSLSGVTGAASITNTGTWTTTGASVFGGGASTLTNSGTLTVSGAASFAALDQFNNSGAIFLGANTLAGAGAVFAASGSSQLRITALLDPAGSTACGVTGIGCLDLTGGATSGVTAVAVTIADAATADVFNPNTIVLVDVTGGASNAGHFVLAPTSTGYLDDADLGGVIGGPGLFAYALRYDADNQQHVLVSAPRRSAFEFAQTAHQVLSTWHVTTEVVSGRQADLGEGAAGSGWLRLIGETSERTLGMTFVNGGQSFDIDNSYSLETGALVAGFDVLEADHATVGVHIGYVQSELAFKNSQTSDKLTGPLAGLYGTWRSGPLTVDGVFNANLLKLEHSTVDFEQNETSVISLGARAEAGWKVIDSDGFYIQPLVSAAYVRSQVNDVLPAGYDIAVEDVTSARAAVGVRTGGQWGAVGGWAVARAWREFAGDSSVSINNTNSSTGIMLADDLGGEFQEIGAGLTLSDAAGVWQGFVSATMRFAEDLDNSGVSAGVRLRW